MYLLSDGDDSFVSDIMKKLSEDGEYQIPSAILDKMQKIFVAGSCDDEGTLSAIRETDKEYGYVMDTHTAVAKSVYDEYQKETGDNTKTVIASTASPFKFNQSVLIALGGTSQVAGKDEFTLLSELSERSGMEIPKSLASLKEKSKLFESVCDKNEMLSVVCDFLKI